MAPIIGWGNMYISVKIWGDSCKNKDDYLKFFLFSSFYTHIKLKAGCTFLLASI